MENLVELITKEVLGRLSRMECNAERPKEQVLVLASASAEGYSRVKKELTSKYEVVSLDDMESDINKYKALIIPVLENRVLANLANGLCGSVREELVIQSILKGKKIFLMEDGIEYRKHADTANKKFLNLYQEYEKKLVEYGIMIVKGCLSDSLDNAHEVGKAEIVQRSIDEESDCAGREVIEMNDKKLITEPDLRKLYLSGVREVRIPKKSVITPLAQDFIRMNRLTVNRV